ncbi:glycosyltransferase [uncultured Methanomethylovorans sp.]|uniref:glycosyltransferase family 4 protein n=1 Tax=uncultured Methanomethylovorans sp. TaxID=183759 RepID=UPI002AA66560|nr:glycosyltransferase [uncultured Methanomethylovorans sp.]
MVDRTNADHDVLLTKEAEEQTKNNGLKKKMYKIAFVVQRYGLEINGGAEFLCRDVAEHLSKYCDIDVITTCAIDYVTWKNEYEAGETRINGVSVKRFPVDFPRETKRFDKCSEKVLCKTHSIDEEMEWMKLQGPYSTKLFKFIEDSKDQYDFFFFFTYLYCTTFFGLPLVADKAILVPAAHDEPPIYLSIFNDIFHKPKAIMYNTKEEKDFVIQKFRNGDIPHDVAGSGVSLSEKMESNNSHSLTRKESFITYMGRIDESKGCGELFDFFQRYKKENHSPIKLIMLGKTVMKIPTHQDIKYLGFVSEEEKYNTLQNCDVLIMPSKYESLSIVLLEAWLCKKPVLVNGQCEVLKGQCIRSNAGLWYENYEEFSECLNLLLADEHLRDQLGNEGRKFVDKHYSWETIERKYLDLIERV